MSEQASSIAVLFPGQGSQFKGMADAWAEHPVSLAVLNEASEATGFDIVSGCRDENLLATTDFVQPALLACEVAAFRVLDDAGVKFEATAGHSLGEFSSLVAADVITLREAINVVDTRGRAMQQAAKLMPGTMSAILRSTPKEVNELCLEAAEDDVLIVANYNMPAQYVISGSIPAIERAEALASDKRIRSVRLPVAGAFHSALMQPAVQPIINELNKIEFRTPRFPIAENVSGILVSDPMVLRFLVERHVTSPVKWEECIRALGAAGITSFVEAGPGKVLSGFTKRILPEAYSYNVNSPDAVLETMNFAANLE